MQTGAALLRAEARLARMRGVQSIREPIMFRDLGLLGAQLSREQMHETDT